MDYNRRRSGHRQGPNAPPSNRLPRSTSTWGERIGSIHMSQPQNMVNAPVAGGTVVNVTVNHGDGENEQTLATNVLHDDLHGSTGRADHEIYSSHLMTRKRGFPLWVPGPGMQLPTEYRRQGVSIGDVGIITSTGEFDFLFNIFLPSDHPINDGIVPQGFSVYHRRLDIQRTIVYGPNTYLASSSVRKTSISEASVDQRFESTAKEAAILILPDGAATQNLLNTRGVHSIISSNARDWYTYARETRERDVRNGDIRVVVGVDKVSSWGMATSACNTGQTASYVFKLDPTHDYKWDCIGGSGRVGPQRREIHDLIEHNTVPQNQCVFVRTINFSLSGKTWNDSSASTEQPDPGSGRFGHRNSTTGNRGRSRGRRGSSGRVGTSSNRHPGPMQEALHCIPSVNFDRVELGVDHPSDALHNCLHEKFPDAKIVITEDMDWISVLNNDDVVFPKPETLCAHILENSQVLNERGIIHLRRKKENLMAGEAEDLGVHVGTSAGNTQKKSTSSREGDPPMADEKQYSARTLGNSPKQTYTQKVQDTNATELAAPETKTKLMKDVEALADSVNKINEAFERVRVSLGKVDENIYKDKNGNPVGKFQPNWVCYQKCWASLLWVSHDAATGAFFKEFLEVTVPGVEAIENDSDLAHTMIFFEVLVNRTNLLEQSLEQTAQQCYHRFVNLRCGIENFTTAFGSIVQDHNAENAAEIMENLIINFMSPVLSRLEQARVNLVNLTSDMNFISSRLEGFAQIWSTVRHDAMVFTEMLIAAVFHQGARRVFNQRVKLAEISNTSLSEALSLYATKVKYSGATNV